MRLKVKDLDISTGGTLLAILNEEDSKKLDLHALDRIKVGFHGKIETVIVNIAESEKTVKRGEIGLVEEVLDSLKVRENNYVEITIARNPLSLSYIKKKLDGRNLTKKEINQIVWDIVHNKLSNIELTYFVAACYTKAMTPRETILLTKAMASQGENLRLKKYPIVDKHSIGGIPGNRTTMLIVPIIASAGYTIPKTSSRSITSPSGTADTMEVLADVSFSIKRMAKIVNRVNGCIVWGGALNLAPADDKIISVEKPMGIDAESQLIASIMAKKLSVNSTHILIDIPVGKNSKIEHKSEALALKKKFEVIAKEIRKHVKVIITDGSEPIGNGIGPALEARDVLYVLTRDSRRPLDLEKKGIMMAGCIFEMLGIKEGKKRAIEILNSGKAYKKMQEIIKMQNGNQNINPDRIPIGKYRFDFKARKSGFVKGINNYSVSRIARIAGAPIDKGAGIYLYKHVGMRVKKGEAVFTVYAEDGQKLDYAVDITKEIEVVEVG